MKITAVHFEESPLFERRAMITTVFEDGSTIEKHLSGAVARRYLRTQRAKIEGNDKGVGRPL